MKPKGAPAVVAKHRQELQAHIKLLSYISKDEAYYRCAQHGKFTHAPKTLRRSRSNQCPVCRAETGPAHKLTHAEYKRRLQKAKPHLRALEEYPGQKIKFKHRCTLHKVDFLSTSGDTLNGGRHACPDCSKDNRGKNKLPLNEFLRRLKSANTHIRYVGGYVTLSGPHKADFRCTVHDFIWSAAPYNVLQGHGCPVCKQDAIGFNMYKKRKPFKLGRNTIEVQGYEPQVLEYLLAEGYHPSDLIVHGHGTGGFQYEHNGKVKWTFPDIHIKSENSYLEVKSAYTLFLTLDGMKAKARSAHKAGIRYEVIVADAKGNIFSLDKTWYRRSADRILRDMSSFIEYRKPLRSSET